MIAIPKPKKLEQECQDSWQQIGFMTLRENALKLCQQDTKISGEGWC